MKKVFSVILSLLFMLLFSSCAQSEDKSYSKDFLDLFDTASSVTASDTSQEALTAILTPFTVNLKSIHSYMIYTIHTAIW